MIEFAVLHRLPIHRVGGAKKATTLSRQETVRG